MDKLLVDADLEKEYTICKVLLLDKKTNYRLLEYGFFSGAKIKVINIAPKKHTFLVSIGGSLIAIDYFLACKVVIYE